MNEEYSHWPLFNLYLLALAYNTYNDTILSYPIHLCPGQIYHISFSYPHLPGPFFKSNNLILLGHLSFGPKNNFK